MSQQRPLFAPVGDERIADVKGMLAHVRVLIDRAKGVTRVVKFDANGEPLGAGLELSQGDVTALIAALSSARGKLAGGA